MFKYSWVVLTYLDVVDECETYGSWNFV